jgi:hypothetical protein
LQLLIVTAKPIAGNELVSLVTLRKFTRQGSVLATSDPADSATQTFIRHQMQASPSFWTVDLSRKCVANALSCLEWLDAESSVAMLEHLCDKKVRWLHCTAFCGIAIA